MNLSYSLAVWKIAKKLRNNFDRLQGHNARSRQELCVSKRNGVAVFCLRFSWVKTENRIRSILVRSLKVPIGRVLLRTSTNLRSIALVVRISEDASWVLIWRKLSRSGRSFLRQSTALGYRKLQRATNRWAAFWASLRLPAWLIRCRDRLTFCWSARLT